MRPILERGGLIAGEDFFLAFSPERVDPGNPTFNTRNIPKVVGGRHADLRGAGRGAVRGGDRDGGSGQLAAGRRDGEAAREHFPRGQHRPGERDRADVRHAWASTCGKWSTRPRPSRSASCRSTRARGSAATAFRSIRSISHGRPSRAASRRGSSSWPGMSTGRCRTPSSQKIADALNTRRKAVNGATILIAGVAYKRDIDDMRESPALDVMHMLQQRGAMVSYADPYVASLPPAAGRVGERYGASKSTTEALHGIRLCRRGHRSPRLRLSPDGCICAPHR